MLHTDTPTNRWFVVESDIKKHARLNMIAHLPSTIPYTEVPAPDVKLPKRLYLDRELPEASARAVHLRTRLRSHVPGRSRGQQIARLTHSPHSDPRFVSVRAC